MNIKPCFYLKNPNSVEKTSIYLYIQNNRKKFKYGIGKSILPVLWDLKTQRPIRDIKTVNKLEKEFPFIKVELQNIHSRIEDITKLSIRSINEMEIGGELDFSLLRKQLNEVYNKKVEESKVKVLNLNDYIESYVSEIENATRLITTGKNKGNRYQKGTIKNYRGFQTQFNEYQKAKRNNLNFESITLDFYDDFLQYFNSKNYSPNTLGRLIKTLKVVMRSAQEEGLHINEEYKRRKFETLKCDVEAIYLNKDELGRLYELNLDDKPNYDLARDVFLCGCYTALRFSDYSRLNKIHFKEQNGFKVIDIITKKTNERVIIPVRPELKKILEKYDYNLPKTYEQKVNDYIKKICKKAKIEERVELREQKGGFVVNTIKPKNELVKTHTARRTGATLMYLAGIPSIDIMKITGHSKESNFLKYIRATKEETACRLASNSFFSGGLSKVS
jgi:integrase